MASNWNEADHPRVPAGSPEGGQFTDKTTGQLVLPGMEGMVSAARKAAGVKLTDIDYEAERFHTMTRQRARERLQQGNVLHSPQPDMLDYEIAWMYDEEGKFIGEVGGSSSNVHFLPEQTDMMYKGWLIHNHPQQGTFSAEDLAFTHRYGMAGMIATTHDGYYKATSKRTFVPLGALREMDSYEIITSWNDVNGPIREGWQKMVRDGFVTPDVAWKNHNQQLFEGFAQNERLNKNFEFEFIRWEDLP